jgi:hypothetical protein
MLPEEQEEVQAALRIHNMGVTRAIEDLVAVKAVLDQSLLLNDYHACEVAAVEFTGAVCVATTGSVTPDVDFDGRRLQALNDLSIDMEWLSVSVDVTREGGAVVFCWLKGAKQPSAFVQSLLAKNEVDLINILPQFLFFYLDNTYFSPSWWNQLSAEDQAYLRGLAKEPNPYYYANKPFAPHRFVPWHLRKLHQSRCL